MKLVHKFFLVSLLIALGPLAWVGWRVVRDVDDSLHAAAWRVQHGLAERTVETARAKLDEVVALLSLLQGTLDVGRPTDIMSAAMTNTPAIVDLWVYGSTQRERLALHRFRAGQGIQPGEWAKVNRQILKRGYFLSPATFTKENPPSLVAAVPVLRDSKGPQGFLAARINLNVLGEVLRGLELGSGGRAFLIDPSGVLIAHSLPDTPAGFSGLSLKFSPPQDETTYTAFDGAPVLAVRAKMPETGWSLIYEQPSALALAAAGQARRRLNKSLGFAALFALLLVLGLSGFVTRPLKQFRNAVQKMQKGEFDSLLPFRSRDEIGEIAQALREAQPILEKRMRDSVLGKMSRLIGHDLRQPVQGLRNSLDAIAQHVTGADEAAQKHFRLSLESLDWMEEFIEDILTVGRERPLSRRSVNLNDVILPILARVRSRPDVVVEARLAKDLPLCRIDDGEARKALLNLITNALEAVGDRGRVEVATALQKDHLLVTITDDGPGLPEEKRARLFEEFTTKGSGTGLGLLVVKKVMDRHGGRVTLESEPGKGVRATLAFPLRVPSE